MLATPTDAMPGTQPDGRACRRHTGLLRSQSRPSPGGTHDGRDGSSTLLQLFQVQRLLWRGVQPGVAGGVEQAGPGGQQPGHKTRTSTGQCHGQAPHPVALPCPAPLCFMLLSLEDIASIGEERAGPLLRI